MCPFCIFVKSSRMLLNSRCQPPSLKRKNKKEDGGKLNTSTANRKNKTLLRHRPLLHLYNKLLAFIQRVSYFWISYQRNSIREVVLRDKIMDVIFLHLWKHKIGCVLFPETNEWWTVIDVRDKQIRLIPVIEFPLNEFTAEKSSLYETLNESNWWIHVSQNGREQFKNHSLYNLMKKEPLKLIQLTFWIL